MAGGWSTGYDVNQFSDTASGVVPASGGGASNFLRADGTWAEPPAGSGGGAPTNATYLVTSAHADLSAEVIVTAAGLALLDDADAAAQRTTLGLGSMATKATVATADINTSAVTYAKIQAVTDARLLGRSAGSAGDVQEITIGANLTLSGGELSGTGGASGAPTNATYLVTSAHADLSAEVVVTAAGLALLDDADAAAQRTTLGLGSMATKATVATADLNTSAVTYAKIQSVSATDKVLGRASAGAGDVEEIACTSAGRALIDDADAAAQRTTLGLGSMAIKATVATADINTSAVTYAKIQAVTDARLLGRSAGSAGDVQEITVGSGLALAAGALTATAAGGGFTSIALQTKTSTGAYTPTTGTAYCLVILTGAGGGGGGADSSTTTNDIGVGGGGGAGETRIGFGSVGIFSNLTVTIGAAGTAGSATNGTNGGNGGSSSFGTVITANGGTGGTGSGVAADSGDSNPGGAGGTGGSGGTMNIDGGDGDCSLAITNDATVGDGSYAWAGQGGASYWGGGGRGGQIFSTTIGVAATSAGVAGKAYGSGGGGAACSDTTGGAAGGAGKAGVCLIVEFIL